MNDRAGVIEDGVSGAPTSEPTRSSWFIVSIAFVVGLGLGALATAPTPDSPPITVPEASGAPLLSTPLDEQPDLPDERGISEVIDGFPDALVALARTSGSTVDYLLWPVSGDLSVRAMSGGTDILLDATAQFVALSTGLPGEETALLSMGRYNGIRPVAPNVTSYAFHDTSNGWLAYTLADGDFSRVMTVKSDFDPMEIVSLEEPGVTVIGWGDWGWALQTPSGEIMLLNPQGEFRDSEVGFGLATHPSGWVFAIEWDEAKLVSGGGGVRRLGPLEGLGAIQNASFSPDASMIALDGTAGLGVLDVGDGSVVRLTEFSTGPTSWSSDSRFVIAVSGSGLLVHDLANGDVHPILRQYTMLTAGVVPLRNS